MYGCGAYVNCIEQTMCEDCNTSLDVASSPRIFSQRQDDGDASCPGLQVVHRICSSLKIHAILSIGCLVSVITLPRYELTYM